MRVACSAAAANATAATIAPGSRAASAQSASTVAGAASVSTHFQRLTVKPGIAFIVKVGTMRPAITTTNSKTKPTAA
ncbi:nnrS domain protein [Burkholderia pseudomallei MSHR2451]|nr:nnrS domain protein [Burkholderia pseudomallei MSHR2451]